MWMLFIDIPPTWTKDLGAVKKQQHNNKTILWLSQLIIIEK